MNKLKLVGNGQMQSNQGEQMCEGNSCALSMALITGICSMHSTNRWSGSHHVQMRTRQTKTQKTGPEPHKPAALPSWCCPRLSKFFKPSSMIGFRLDRSKVGHSSCSFRAISKHSNLDLIARTIKSGDPKLKTAWWKLATCSWLTTMIKPLINVYIPMGNHQCLQENPLYTLQFSIMFNYWREATWQK